MSTGRRLSDLGLGCFLLPVALGCAPKATSPSGAQTAPAAEQATPTEPVAQGPQPDRADVLYAAHPAVPPPPPPCALGAPLPASHSCDDARGDLAAALSMPGAARDEALAALEACADFEPGLVRALRADLGAAECADVLVAPVVGEEVQSSGAALAPDLREALVGLGLAARLHRLAAVPPVAPAIHKKETLEIYYKEALFPWIESQAAAIYAMSGQGKALHGYGKGLVAIEAGNADMRFVEIARNAPLAEEIEKVPEARDLYYSTLDEQLEPRKGRGSAAALVGMREMAQLGVRESERLSSARALLSRAYGGRRVNALDTLLVPSLAPEKATEESTAIASRVPTVYATALVGQAAVSPQLVRAHLQMGMPLALRRSVESGEGGALAQLYLARALFEQGRTYFRAQDFQDAQLLLNRILDAESAEAQASVPAPAPVPGLNAEQREQAILLRALCVALLAGPKDAAEMIAQGPRFAEALGNLVLLDALAEGKTETAARAAFNAAYLRELVVKPGDPAAWSDLALRYSRAAKQLRGDEARRAKDRAAACRDIEKNVRAQLTKKAEL